MKILINARLRQLKNTLKASGKRKYFIFILLAAGILFVMGYFSIKVFGFLYHQEAFPDFFKLFLCEKILMMTFMTMFVMMILSALIATLNMFFLSRDLNLLLASPIGSGKVFAWKIVEVGISSAVMVIFFSIPVLFAYSYYFAPGVWEIAALILVFVLFMVSGVFIGILVGLIIPAFFSVRKLQPVLSLVSIVFISGIVIFLRVLRPEQFSDPKVINNIMEYMSGLDVKGFSFFPFFWISKALGHVAKGDYMGYLKEVATFAGLIAAIGGVFYFLQKKYYRQLVDKLNKTTGGAYRSSWKPPRILKGRMADYSTLWKKEIKTFFRTPAQWSQLLIIAAIVVVFVLNIKGMPMPHPSVKNIIAYLSLGMAAFVVAGLNSRFTFTAIPMEYPGIVYLLSSPFKKEKLFRFKVVFYAIPQLIIGFILFVASDISLDLDAFARVAGAVFLVPLLPFLTILALYFSLRVDESTPLSPQHLIASKSGISYMLWSMIAVVLGMVYFVRPIFIYYYYGFTRRPIPLPEITAWFLGFIVINLILIFFFHSRSTKAWKKREFTASA